MSRLALIAVLALSGCTTTLTNCDIQLSRSGAGDVLKCQQATVPVKVLDDVLRACVIRCVSGGCP